MMQKGKLKTRILSVFICAANFFLSTFGFARLPSAEYIDMSRFEETPVFCEEFSGDRLNTEIWTSHYADNKVRRGGYWDNDMAVVKDGVLTIKTQYLPEGLNGGPAGWYSAGLDTSGSYLQKYGYFECRCIMPAGTGHWSAFWLFCGGVGDITGDGRNGTEIDVMESPFWSNSKLRNSTQHALHYDGYGEAHQSEGYGNWLIKGDPYSEFHTYGVEWNEDCYRFYIDGRLTCETSFGGVSQVPEFLILSVEVGGQNGVAADDWSGPSIDKNEGGRQFTSDFIVDYVKCYQYKA